MNRIVETGLKLDLHIHSHASSPIDGRKVRNNTLENIPLLIEKLNENAVNICAITDHNVFSYEMYSALKMAELEENSIMKVLPGVEFSVNFKNSENAEGKIHIVTLFSDEDDVKVQRINYILSERITDSDSYDEDVFLDILRQIDIDTILIAHQKNTLSSQSIRANDSNSLGEAKFFEFIYSDYFEALEFRNRRNEILNKNYLRDMHLDKQVSLVTGTDCHDWTVYPKINSTDSLSNFPFTYAKCLPTFKGLVMAMTDPTRLKRDNSFFSVDKPALEKISISTEGEQVVIPLSKGINAIIGDNSVGKSLLIHALTGFKKNGLPLPSETKSGYKKYMQQHNLKIQKQLGIDEIFKFDMQGEVRKNFEEHFLDSTEFLGQYFPPQVNAQPYRTIIENEINRMIDYLEKKFKLDAKIEELTSFILHFQDSPPDSLVFVHTLKSNRSADEPFTQIISALKTLEEDLKTLLELQVDEEDRTYFSSILEVIDSIQDKYLLRLSNNQLSNARIEMIIKAIRDIATAHNRGISDSHKRTTNFTERTSKLVETLTNILQQRQALDVYTPSLEPIDISPNSSYVHEYEFINKLHIDRIDTSYFQALINQALKRKKSIDWRTITEKKLKEMLLGYDSKSSVLEHFRKKLLEIVSNDLSPCASIIYQGMDKYAELSSGLDSKIYFDLLSYETVRDGVYIIDQPEDNVSQSAIRDYLLGYFKSMAENRQVIIITHNPQFVVNLDVDNLIYLSQTSGKLCIQSGALEFVCDDYNVLNIVATHIDGGLESIRRRWKRYEKTAAV